MNITQTRIALSQLRRRFGEPAGEQTDRELLARFTAGDEHAFALLVHRHGPMVLGVCRCVLKNRTDAEDAFQAVFLALARQAGSSSPSSVGGWLHTVARRIAVKLRAGEALRQMRERLANDRKPVTEPQWADLREVLDEEVTRLPTKCREAILRCYFHGQTREQAARQLGWSLRTLERRLEQGRQILRERLTARGTTLAVLLALAPATVPSALAEQTVRAALGDVSRSVAALASAVTSGFTAVRWKLALVGILLAGLAAGTGLVLPAKTASPARALPPTPTEKPLAATPTRPDEPPLPEHAIARLGSTRFRHGPGVFGLAYSKDGNLLASIGGGCGLFLWEAKTGQLLHRCDPSPRVAVSYSVALSPDGRYAASGEGRLLKLWHVKTGKAVRSFSGHSLSVMCVAFSPRGNLLASGSHDRSVRLWHPHTGQQLHVLEGHADTLWALAFRDDGKVLASASLDGMIRLWDAQTAKLLQVCKGPNKVVNSLAFERDGKRLVSAGDDGSVRVWNSDTGNPERTLIADSERALALAFAPDGKTLAVGLADRTLRLLDFATGKEVRRWFPHVFPTRCLAWAPDGKVLASGSGSESMIRLWDPQTGIEKTPASGHVGSVYHLAFHQHGRRLLSFGSDNRLLDWDLAAKTSRPLQPGLPSMPPGATAVTLDGKRLAWASGESTRYEVHMFDTATGTKVQSFTGATKDALGVAFAPDGEHLASASQDGILRLWHTHTGKLLWQTPMQIGQEFPRPRLKNLLFSPDGKFLVYGSQDGILRLFDARRGKLIRKHAYGRTIWSLAWSPDSLHLAITGGQNMPAVVRWNARTGEVSRSWQSPEAGYGVAFSPDGRLLAVEGDAFGAAIYLWEVATGRAVASFKGGAVTPSSALAFSPDGRRLASGNGDSLILLWDVTGRAPDGHLRPTRVSAARFASLWDNLASDDAKTAHAAAWELVAGGSGVLPLLKAKLPAATALDTRRAAKLIERLDADEYETRQSAMKEAEKLGLGAEPALRKVLGRRPALEVRRRFDVLVAGWLGSSDWLRYRRAVAVLEYNGSDEAKEILTALARGAEGARPTKEAAAAAARLRDGR